MTEEHLLCIDPECDEDGAFMLSRQPFIPSDNAEVTGFLGKGAIDEIPIVAKPFYDELLAWVLDTYIHENDWKVLRILNQQNNPEPRYRKMSIGPGKEVEVIANGAMFLQRGEARLIVQLWLWRRAMVIISCDAANRTVAEQFAADINRLMVERNPYRKANIHYGLFIDFLEVKKRNWEDLILSKSLKEAIRINSVEFLNHSQLLKKYDIPAKRGILLAGMPGTGKTLISKIIMSTSPDITCIESETSRLGDPDYIESLYDLADDLKPAIIFLEDLDIAGRDRFAEGNPRDTGLVALLAALDGIEECSGVVTIATTNCVQVLDKALRDRPSRFDTVIEMCLPNFDERRHLIKKLSKRIPIEAKTIQHIAEKTSGFTPAQLQEVVYSMVIRKQSKFGNKEMKLPLRFQSEDIQTAIAQVARSKTGDMGFRMR
jgi:cell division protease FtsH